MLPLLSLGPLVLPTYPLLLLVAFWAGLKLAARQAGKWGLESDHIYNAGLYGFLGGLVGARLWFVISYWDIYLPDLTQAFSLSRSALSPGGGIVIGTLIILIYLRRYEAPLGVFLEAIAPGLALAIAIGQAGAFLGGEGLGAPSSAPWAIVLAGVLRHPVQLYEAAVALLILGILLGISYRPWPGFRFWLLLSLYGAGRLILEIFRAQPPMMAEGYLINQVVSLTTIVISLTIMGYFFSKNSTETGSEIS